MINQGWRRAASNYHLPLLISPQVGVIPRTAEVARRSGDGVKKGGASGWIGLACQDGVLDVHGGNSLPEDSLV